MDTVLCLITYRCQLDTDVSAPCQVGAAFGPSTMGKDFQKIRPSTIASEGYDDVFQSVWNRSIQYFRNEIFHKVQNHTFVGDLNAALNSEDTIDYSHEVILNNLTLGPDWWDTFKAELLEKSMLYQRRNISSKQHEFHKLQGLFYKLSEGDPEKDLVNKKLHDLLKDITKEFNFQKAKDKRLTHERFSSNFFKQASKDRKISRLTELKGFNNEILNTRVDIQDHLLLQYFYLYQSEPVQEENLNLFLKYIPKLKKKENTEPFTYAEALQEFKNMVPGTCPGPDGIPCDFYKKYFSIFGKFYVRMINNCMRDGVIPKSWNISILKVIPKVPDEIPSFDTLRPLTLGNVDCKHEAAMLCRRMVAVARDVIHDLQTGGIPNRKIQNSVFLIHLLINLFKEQDWCGYIVALDNYKAFDKLIREFLWIILTKMGFNKWTINAIQLLYKNTSAKIIVNGFLSEPFPVESGVKQGCPLSSLLFAIALEPLARAILEDPIFKDLGFKIPLNKEIRLLQHLDDMTLFAKNSIAVSAFMKKVLQFNKLSGLSINYRKSFIIRLDTQSRRLAIDGPSLCGINVLPEHEFKKILGIYFGSIINGTNGYVEKNWEIACEEILRTLKVWEICFSNDSLTSLMGRALIVHVMVHSKLIYLMQIIQFSSEALDKINKAVKKFLWAGKKHIPMIAMENLEAPVRLGGLGIKPLSIRAITLRYDHIRNFFVRDGEDWMIQKSPTDAIIFYFLNQSIRALVPNMNRQISFPLHLVSKYHKPGNIQFIGHLPKIFDILYWDIERAISVIGDVDFFEKYPTTSYLDDLMERKHLKFRQNSTSRPLISYYNFSPNIEKIIWDNIGQTIMDPKIKAFSYKLAHNCLPTKHAIWLRMKHFQDNTFEPFCQFCKLVLLADVHCTSQHIFMECLVAKNTWNIINSKLQAAEKPQFQINKRLIFFRLNLNKSLSTFISEILWALWRINNYNNYEISEAQTHLIRTDREVLSVASQRLKYNSNLDKEIHKNRIYIKKWSQLNEVIRIVFDNG